MAGFEAFLEVLSTIAFLALGVLTLRLWLKRRDRQSLAMFLTFLDLSFIVIAGQVLDRFDDQSAAIFTVVQNVVLAILLLFPYLLYRVARSFEPGATATHLAAAIPTAIVVTWSFFLPRLPEDGEIESAVVRAWVIAVLFQWTLCSVLVAVRFWRAGTNQPPVTRKRMRLMAIAATALALGIVVSGRSGGEQNIATEVVTDLLALLSAASFYLAFAPPRWLRSLWRRESEENIRRAAIDLMKAESDADVVGVLLPHASTVIGAGGVAMLDPDGRVIGSSGGGDQDWAQIAIDDESGLRANNLTKLEFPFGCLLVQTTPYTLFFGRDEIDLLGALGVLTNLALERVASAEMRVELAQSRLRRQQALEINDNVVQGLAVAKYAFDLGEQDKAKEAIDGTLAAARRIISDLLDEVPDSEVLEGFRLTREKPATGFGIEE